MPSRDHIGSVPPRGDRDDRTANTGLFVVYNEIDEFGSNPLWARADRSLIIKYSYLIDVFR